MWAAVPHMPSGWYVPAGPWQQREGIHCACLSVLPRSPVIAMLRARASAPQITGFFVAIITVLATCLDAGLQGKAFLTGDVKGDIERLEEGGGAADATKADDLAYRPDWFHFCFALASMYIAMVFTGELAKLTPPEAT